ncbi:hypothetical protein ACHAXS_012592 [Conticribra weissflogii]
MTTTTTDKSSGQRSDPAPPSALMNSRKLPSTAATEIGDGENSTNSSSPSPGNDDATKANHESANASSSSPTPSTGGEEPHADEKKEDRDERQAPPTDDVPTAVSNVAATSSGQRPSSPPKNKRPFLKQMDSYKMNIDESPFEHGFQPGDHVIRWDMLPILWPIQIHGIVLEVSDDRTTVTICDFGITTVKEDKKGGAAADTASNGGFTKSEETILAEAIRKLDATLDGPSSSSEESSDSEEDVEPPPYSPSQDEDDGSKDNATMKKKARSKNRLNVITLTKWSDLRKWQKVNYEGGFGAGGVGKGLKKLGNTTGKLWSSMTKTFAKGSQEHLPTEELEHEVPAAEGVEMVTVEKSNDERVDPTLAAEAKQDIDEVVTLAKSEPKSEGNDESIGATITTESKNGKKNESNETLTTTEPNTAGGVDVEVPSSPSKNDKIQPPSKLLSPRSSCEGGSVEESCEEIHKEAKAEVEIYDPTLDESKTLAEMIAEANEIERRSRKVVLVKTAPSSPEKKPVVEKKDSWYGSLTKSFSSMLTQKEEKESSYKDGGTCKPPSEEVKQKQIEAPDNLPKSDPPALVLARTRFLLEQGEDVLPPYHIINSNSECIAVWCKTGRWSTLQAAIFLHSTAIGNAKSSTALTLTVAAVQPWLIPVMAGAGIAAVGTPWLFLKLANDKWNEATMRYEEFLFAFFV